MRDFSARVSLGAADGLLVSAGGGDLRFPDLDTACRGGVPATAGGLERLVLAALRRFTWEVAPDSWTVGRAGSRGQLLSDLEIRCETTVPRQVGLAGSSAVIIATIRALASYVGVVVPSFELAEMALAAEVEDLAIAAGPMDRVIQAYERPMVLDLRPPRTESSYRPLDPGLFPPMLIAWAPGRGRSSDYTHSDLRTRWQRGDADVIGTVRELRGVVDRGLLALERRDPGTFADLVDRNFELRIGVTEVTDADREMVELARDEGAAAKLCGSGGAVLVVPRECTDPSRLEAVLEEAGFHTCRPTMA